MVLQDVPKESTALTQCIAGSKMIDTPKNYVFVEEVSPVVVKSKTKSSLRELFQKSTKTNGEGNSKTRKPTYSLASSYSSSTSSFKSDIKRKFPTSSAFLTRKK